MFTVCDSTLKILSDWASLAAAKEIAKIRKSEYPNQIFFVCDHTGQIIAGY